MNGPLLDFIFLFSLFTVNNQVRFLNQLHKYGNSKLANHPKTDFSNEINQAVGRCVLCHGHCRRKESKIDFRISSFGRF